MLRSLLERLEEHSPGEREHAHRVAAYAVAAGDALGLRGQPLQELRYAAELHDIGKLLVASELLQRKESLSAEEREKLVAHVTLAGDVVGGLPFLEPCLAGIRFHHERWNGGGYPDGLTGIDIPFAARIIGAAEVLDVALHGTHWRPADQEDVALSALAGLSGTWFEPAVVDALLRVQPLIQPLGA